MRVLLISIGLTALAACGMNDSEGAGTAGTGMSTPVEAPANPGAPLSNITGETCGGISGTQCPSGFFCEQPAGQCLEDFHGTGTCQPTPEFCTEIYTPVCGCDGQTYSNQCVAATAGVSIAVEGECASPDTH